MSGPQAQAPDSFRPVRAQLSFPATDPQELRLHTGDIVQVVEDEQPTPPEGWLKARWLSAGDDRPRGFVPKSFVEDF